MYSFPFFALYSERVLVLVLECTRLKIMQFRLSILLQVSEVLAISFMLCPQITHPVLSMSH